MEGGNGIQTSFSCVDSCETTFSLFLFLSSNFSGLGGLVWYGILGILLRRNGCFLVGLVIEGDGDSEWFRWNISFFF